MNVEYVMDAVNKAIEEQVIPKLFSPAQRSEMAEPHHEKWDHYNFSPLMTGDTAYAALGGLAPQLAINDPRISEAQIAAAPKTLKVTVGGKEHTVPLRVYKNYHETVQEWQETRDFQAESRKAISQIEKGLSVHFNLTAGRDYSIGYGIGGVGDLKAASYIVQVFNAKTLRKQGDDIKKYVQDKLAEVTPGRPSQVIIGGPARIG